MEMEIELQGAKGFGFQVGDSLIVKNETNIGMLVMHARVTKIKNRIVTLQELPTFVISELPFIDQGDGLSLTIGDEELDVKVLSCER